MRRIVILGLLVLLAMVAAPAVSAAPDLVVTDVLVNSGETRDNINRVYVNGSNDISAVVHNNGPDNVTDDFDVCFEADGAKIGCATVTGGLTAGTNTTVSIDWTPTCTDYPVMPGFPPQSLPLTINVTADCNCGDCPNCPPDGTCGTIAESDEANNTFSKVIPAMQVHATYNVIGGVVNNGYKSKNFDCDNTEEPLDQFKYYELVGGGVEYNVTGVKISTFATQATSTRVHHIDLPVDAVVKDARLYVYWYDKWGNYKTYPTGCLADLNVNFDGTDLTPDVVYQDSKAFGYYQSPKGSSVFNVTDHVDDYVLGGSSYTAIVKNVEPIGGNNTTLLGEMLVVVYDGACGDEVQIWMLEGTDYLMAADDTHNPSYDFSVSPEDATATVAFGGSINEPVDTAQLITIVAQGQDPGSDMLFNGNVIKTDAWDTPTEAYPSSKIDVEDISVKSNLLASGNNMGFRDTGTGGMQAQNAFLIVVKKPNNVYFVPKVSEVSGGAGTNFTVDVWVNATETINSWQTDIAFDYSCIDVINVTYGWSGYNGLWTWGPGQITMGDSRVSGISGDMLLATLTIHCKDCCASSLDFTGTHFLKQAGVGDRSAGWENGSVICGTPVGVVKTVWDPDADAWVDTMDVQDLDTNVTFNCTVDATCCNLTDLIVTDEMDDGLMYSGGATVNGIPCPPDVVMDAGRTLVWNTLSDLDAGQTLTIKFNATTEAYGVPCNVVTVTGLCDGIPISADDDACIRMGMPKIAVEPIETIIQPQEQFDINITVDPSGACEVYGVEYDLHYDPTVLRAESLVKGPFLGEISETMVSYIDIDEVNGIVSYAETRKNPPCPGGVTDPGVVTRIHFTAIGARGATTTLNLTTVIIVDDATMEAFEPVDTINGTVSINDNVPPVPIPQLKHRINNVAQKYQSTAILCSCSYDPDGFITYLRWAFGDGQFGTSEGLHEDNCTCKEHDYESHQWEPYGVSTGHYVPFSATLTVTDNGCPEESNSTFMNVTVYIAGDANGDGKVNVLDAVWVGKHWRETCCTSPPCDPCLNCESYLWVDEQADGADLNNDCKINVLDAVIIGANWRHVAW